MMQLTSFGQTKEMQKSVQRKTLLFVGPKPPPIGGSPLTVLAMLEELAEYSSVQVVLINTSPATDVRREMAGFKFEKVIRSFAILPKYIYEIPRCDAVLVFANDLFAITLAPFLLFVARLFHKPFYLKPVGAGLDLFIKAQKKIFQNYLLHVLRATTGILTQTNLLKDDLSKLGCPNAYYIPGCRSFAHVTPEQRDGSDDFRIIFLGHITRQKGPLFLIDAVKTLGQICDRPVTCDFYGPIVNDVRCDFLDALKVMPNVHYCGVAEPGAGPQIIAKYDALILPTYYETEGHPGVLIEAMHAGVPAIATQIRTLSELIKDGVNGFLVPTQDSRALAEAIKKLAMDPPLQKKMALANHQKGQEFRADVVVKELLRIVFPEIVHEQLQKI